jgi:hypothetical protein
MFNYKSVTNSEPQIRSNPALRHVNEKSGFQKRLSTLLEPTPLPFPTFQIMKEGSQTGIQQFKHYAWIRPAHIRPQWLVLSAELPLMLMDPRNPGRLWSLRIPFDKKRVQSVGPIVCEAAWDAQEHILWIWDIVVWEKQNIWSTTPYSQRWDIVKEVVGSILDCGHPMSDAEVRVPDWKSLTEVSVLGDLDPAKSIEFQPEKAGQRRHVFVVRDEGAKFKAQTHAERKMVAEGGPKIHNPNLQKQEKQRQKEQKNHEEPQEHGTVEPNMVHVENATPHIKVSEKGFSAKSQPNDITVARIKKDDYSKLPDAYQLEDITTKKSLGLPAIRGLEISKLLRETLKVKDSCIVDVQWYEPFRKFEVRRVHA